MASDVIELTSALVAIDSVNPSLVEGGAGESAIAAFVAEWATANGLEARTVEETSGRPSVIVTARGTGGGKTLLLCGHIDTVNVEGVTDPHTPRIDGDRLHGRGAYDMKAGVAAALIAARDAKALDLRGDVVVAAVADEEHSSIGIQECLRAITADAAIVTEPTEMEVIVAHKGFVWAEVEVTGEPAHGSRPHLGVDAIVKMGPILTALGKLDNDLGEHNHPLLGRGSVHASVIEGGVELSSYPGRCVLGLERRTLPGETEQDIAREVADLIERAKQEDPDLVAEQRTLLVREPFEVDPDAEIVRAVVESAPGDPSIGGASYWADAAFIQSAGIPTVMFGPSGEGAHALEEWVSIADTEAVTRMLVEVAKRLCG